MTVSLSPIGGAASQFFNSGGVPLYGGKIYTYEAGTTTPKATYTQANGLTAHPNPIILNSAGRVPGGEIWLTSAQAYLFILKNSSDETIGTYDNIYGINAGGANAVTETQVATAGQTDFVLTSMAYTPGVFTLGVYIDGVNQVVNNSYVETSATTVTFVSGLHVGALVKFININSAATDSNVVSYLPAGAGAVATTVQAKLRETVSVKDFGAVGDGVADDTAAIQAALSSGSAAVFIPKGNYKITTTLSVPGRVCIYGEGGFNSTIRAYGCDALTFNQPNSEGETYFYEDFSIEGLSGANYTAIYCPATGGIKYGLHFNRLRIRNINAGIKLDYNLHCSIDKCSFTQINQPIELGDTSTFTRIRDNIIISMGGDTHGSAGDSIGVYLVGGSNCEATKISGNFIYGFATGIKIDTVTDVNILDNGIDACLQYGIYFTAVQHIFNVKNNFIELLGAGAVAGIYGAPLGGGEYPSKINIEGNSFTEIGGATVSTTGILINTAVDTFQWHLSITDNIFNSMKLNDIRVNLPGETFILRNRMISSAPTHSLWIGSVNKAPVRVEDNWLFKDLYNDVASDLTSGKLTLRRNAISDVFTPDETYGTWVPTDASGAGLLLTVNSANFTRNGKQWLVQCDITWPATADGSTSRISLPSIPNASYAGSIAYQTIGSVVHLSTSNGAANWAMWDVAAALKTNASMSGKRVSVTFQYATA